LPAERLLLRAGIPAWGPGNVVSVFVRSEHVTEVFTSFGERGVRAEMVAERVVRRVRRYLAAGVPVGRHLADQLLLPMALCGDGEFLTLEPSLHTLTNMAVVNAFMDVQFLSEEIRADAWRIAIQ
jgi:RNA 3'-terminal phosphate cyclase (ATP)